MKTIIQELVGMMNDMKKKKIIKKWALCGGVAAKYYVNPPITKDIDFFVIIDNSSIMFMSPVYAYMVQHGAKFKGHMLEYKNTLVDIIGSADELIVEGINKAEKVTIDGIKVDILTADYLAAIALSVGRKKDIDRVVRLYNARLLKRKFYELTDRLNISKKPVERIVGFPMN